MVIVHIATYIVTTSYIDSWLYNQLIIFLETRVIYWWSFVHSSTISSNWVTTERVNNPESFCVLIIFMYTGIITGATMLPLTTKVIL